MGNRTREDTLDPQGTLRRTHARTYDSLNRLLQDIGAAGQTTQYSYDPNGNLTTVTDPLDRATTSAYDALNRLATLTDPLNGLTEYEYDAHDHLLSVTDPKQLTTAYTYDGLGNRVAIQSPDTGLRSTDHDAAGNPIRETDARGVMVLYSYDALDRRTAIDYPGVAEDVAFSYDQGPTGIGRLTGMTDGSGTTAYQYDSRGRLSAQTVDHTGIPLTTRYAYDAAERLVQITYPSGRVVDYGRDAAGYIRGVSTTFNGETQTLASAIDYAPFGPVTALTFGNGLVSTRAYDTAYRLTDLSVPGLQDLGYAYDVGDSLIAITNRLNPARSQAFGYDALNRLETAQGRYGSLGYTYDALGNRLSETVNGLTTPYHYAATSQRLLSTAARTFQYDANGNTTSDGLHDLSYGENNRLQEIRQGGAVLARYGHNGRGERIAKVQGAATIFYHYDPDGQLLAETDQSGRTLKEYVYLNGLPLARFTAGSTGGGHPPSVSSTTPTPRSKRAGSGRPPPPWPGSRARTIRPTPPTTPHPGPSPWTIRTRPSP
jgi:YD repeat-containing protein